ncbi:MAG: hypothetical protein ABSF22_02580, partial [Bryobacteraceae bacterium]
RYRGFAFSSGFRILSKLRARLVRPPWRIPYHFKYLEIELVKIESRLVKVAAFLISSRDRILPFLIDFGH